MIGEGKYFKRCLLSNTESHFNSPFKIRFSFDLIRVDWLSAATKVFEVRCEKCLKDYGNTVSNRKCIMIGRMDFYTIC